MKVLQMNLELQPIDGVDKLQVAYGVEGWFINFHMGVDASGSVKQYTIFNGFVICGGFGLLNAMKYLGADDYLYKEHTGRDLDKVIYAIEQYTIADFEKFAAESLHDHPHIIKFDI